MIRKFINRITFGRLCKPKKELVILYFNGIPIASFDKADFDPADLYQPVRFSTTFTIKGNIFEEHDHLQKQFPELEETLNTLNIPKQSDLDQE